MERLALIKKANELGYKHIAFTSKGFYTVFETKADRSHGLDSKQMKFKFRSEFPDSTILADRIEL